METEEECVWGSIVGLKGMEGGENAFREGLHERRQKAKKIQKQNRIMISGTCYVKTQSQLPSFMVVENVECYGN